MLQKTKQLILRTPNLGLKKQKEDERDLGYSLTAFFGIYEPLYDRHILEFPFEAKSQFYNTCGWVSSTAGKEYDEQIELDERGLVILAKNEGLLSGDGYSYLRDNERMLQNFGIPEKGVLPKSFSGWSDYSDPKYITKELLDSAAKHKTKSFSRIYTVNEFYKAIDDGRPVKLGISWRTAFNMSGGFSFPWLLNFLKGIIVGGHAVIGKGYDLNYKTTGNRCANVRNSYGKSYGDNGDFWIKEEDLAKQIKNYGAYINYDMDKDILKWLVSHQDKMVKSSNNPDVFLINGDKKHKFTDVATISSHGRHAEDIIIVDPEYLNSVESGEDINFWDGEVVKGIKAIIQQSQRGDLKNLYSKYFNELF